MAVYVWSDGTISEETPESATGHGLDNNCLLSSGGNLERVLLALQDRLDAIEDRMKKDHIP